MLDMEKKKLRKRRYYLRHKEEILLKQKLYYENHKEECKDRSKKWFEEHSERRRELSRNYLKKLKEEIFELLGNKCNNPECPIPREKLDKRMLQIDHVYGGGLKEHKNSPSSYSYYRHILEQVKVGSKNYQLLCVYCNWFKRIENNENSNKRNC